MFERLPVADLPLSRVVPFRRKGLHFALLAGTSAIAIMLVTPQLAHARMVGSGGR
jgi:hypothetical protein